MPTNQLCSNCGHAKHAHIQDRDKTLFTCYSEDCICADYQPPASEDTREARAKAFMEDEDWYNEPAEYAANFAESEIARERPLIEAEVTAKVIDEFVRRVEKELDKPWPPAGDYPTAVLEFVAEEMKREAEC